MKIKKEVLENKSLYSLQQLLKQQGYSLYFLSSKTFSVGKSINPLRTKDIKIIEELQKLDEELYGGMGAPYWVIFTFGIQTGFIPIITDSNEKIISYAQISGTLNSEIAQLWGLGTNPPYQKQGFGTLTYVISKKMCKKLGMSTLHINVEPSNNSVRIYAKDKPEIIAFGEFYPEEEARMVLEVNLKKEPILEIEETKKLSAQEVYEELPSLLDATQNTSYKVFVADWEVIGGLPHLTLTIGKNIKY